METIRLTHSQGAYDISVGRGLIKEACKLFNLKRRVLVITDEGVPQEYAKSVLSQCLDGRILTVGEGEGSKSFGKLEEVLSVMTEMELDRGDCAIAVGGGVVGDLTGFAASLYMRGIDFYNIPTTLLSQVDSSIGGKTGINFMEIKNTVGTFYQPKGVIIDPELLATLPERQISNGLAEVVKMALTLDAELFLKLEKLTLEEILSDIESIIIQALKLKRAVVEADEREGGLRKVLNFGHTLGHGIEAAEEMSGMYHGECVALGMIPMCAKSLAERLLPVLKKLGLPTEYGKDIERALSFTAHDKKKKNGKLSTIFVPEAGNFEVRDMTSEEFSLAVKSSILN